MEMIFEFDKKKFLELNKLIYIQGFWKCGNI